MFLLAWSTVFLATLVAVPSVQVSLPRGREHCLDPQGLSSALETSWGKPVSLRVVRAGAASVRLTVEYQGRASQRTISTSDASCAALQDALLVVALTLFDAVVHTGVADFAQSAEAAAEPKPSSDREQVSSGPVSAARATPHAGEASPQNSPKGTETEAQVKAPGSLRVVTVSRTPDASSEGGALADAETSRVSVPRAAAAIGAGASFALRPQAALRLQAALSLPVGARAQLELAGIGVLPGEVRNPYAPMTVWAAGVEGSGCVVVLGAWGRGLWAATCARAQGLVVSGRAAGIPDETRRSRAQLALGGGLEVGYAPLRGAVVRLRGGLVAAVVRPEFVFDTQAGSQLLAHRVGTVQPDVGADLVTFF